MVAKVIAVSGQKGGSGKSSICMSLAVALNLRHNKKVLIIDGDTQSTVTKWSGCASEDSPFPCAVVSLAHAGGKAHRSIKNFIDDYDFICIDCPPNTEAEFNASALLIADLALIPVKPSSPDLWAVEAMMKLINAATTTNEKLLTRIVLNMCEPNKKLSQSIVNYFKNDSNLNLLKTQVNNRAIYGEVALSGETVYTSKNSKAKNEIALLTDEVLSLLQ